MTKAMTALIILGALLAGCAGTPVTPTDTETASLAPPTELPTFAATPTQEPTPVAPTPTSPPAFTPTTTPTPLPPITVSFYRLRIEYSTTSDWTDLILENPAHVLTARLMDVHGDPSNIKALVDHLALDQPLSTAEAGQSVGITVDYALAPEALDRPLQFVLHKGALNGSIVRVFAVVGGEEELIREIDHQVVVEDDPGSNPLPFSVNLTALRDSPPSRVEIPRAVTQKMLWAFYYPWYNMDDWASPILKDRPATRYSSDDRQAMARHVEQAQSAGIDGFISSWFGPVDRDDRNLRILLDIAQERNFSVTVYFETLAEEGPLAAEEIFHWLAYLIRTHRDHPAFMKVDGKPLVVIWASAAVPLETWESVFSDLRAQGLDATFLAGNYDLSNLEVFDGLHEYGVFAIPDLVGTFRETARGVRYYSLLADTVEPKIWAATVQPGYDDRLIPGREGLFQDRMDGEFYRSTFEAALRSDPDWIFITTWNEWWEHTYIEPSERFGDQYLRITREFAEG